MPVRVPRLDQPPHRCAFTLRADDPEGFFTGQTISGWDPTAAISVSYARSLARDLGYVHPDDHAALKAELEDHKAELAETTERLDALDERFHAIDVLASAGFAARKKPGRPAQTKEKV